MSLCTTCRLFSLDLADWEMYKHYSSGRRPFRRKIFNSGRALELSAHTCSLCKAFWDALNGSNNDQEENLEPVFLRIWVSVGESSVGPDIPLGLSSFIVYHGPRIAYFAVGAAEDSPISRRGDVVGHLVRNAHNSRLAMSWLQQCLETHHTCNRAAHQIRSERNLPTRLLDVFFAENATRIVTTFTEDIEYSTLSHCWGRSPIIQTTKSLLEHFKNIILLSDLSKTFREAILVCRSLGIQFLWIDSLCIIQDDPLDWERESAKMADVYSGSHLNLAAAAASDGTEGLFFERLERIKVRCKLSTGEHDDVFITNSPSSYFMDSREGPLASRAWALQEKVLPPRTLIFGKDQLHWECHEELKSESSRKNMQIDQSFSSSLRRYLSSEPEPNEEISAQCKLWYKMLEAYTRCDLTKSEDKLPALVGLANAFSRRSGFSYTAGIWEEDLEMGLLWKSLFPKETQLPLSYRAPTWSWAALDTKVRYLRNIRKANLSYSLVRNLHLETFQGDEDPFGIVAQETKLFLTGRLRNIVLLADFETETAYPWKLMIGQHHVGYATTDTYYSPWEIANVGTYCLPILKLVAANTSDSRRYPFEIHLLILAAKDESDSYERIGIGVIRDIELEKIGPDYDAFEDIEEAEIVLL